MHRFKNLQLSLCFSEGVTVHVHTHTHTRACTNIPMFTERDTRRPSTLDDQTFRLMSSHRVQSDKCKKKQRLFVFLCVTAVARVCCDS